LRLFFLACFLVVGCSSPPFDDFSGGEGPDATFPFDVGLQFDDDAATEAEAGPQYLGGPLACGGCTCDGTLYGCLTGTCVKPPPQPDAGSDANADASDAADGAIDAAPSCAKGTECFQIPTVCLPKPTCACIQKETGFQCAVANDGSGFILTCI
jgi:hypothetical protein